MWFCLHATSVHTCRVYDACIYQPPCIPITHLRLSTYIIYLHHLSSLSVSMTCIRLPTWEKLKSHPTQNHQPLPPKPPTLWYALVSDALVSEAFLSFYPKIIKWKPRNIFPLLPTVFSETKKFIDIRLTS